MVLLIGLNPIEHLAQIILRELKHAGVVQSRHMLFGGQQIGTQIGVSLLFRRLGGRIECLKGRRR